MDPSRAGTTTKGTQRWLSALGAVLVVTALPVTGLAQDPNPRPVRPVAAETPSSVLASTEDIPRSAQVEIEQALSPTQRGASGAHRRYAAAAPVRTRAERTARRNAQARLIRLAQRFAQRGEARTAYPRERRMPEAYRPRRANRGWDDGFTPGARYRGRQAHSQLERRGWRRGGGGYGRRGWMGRGGRGGGF